MSVPIAARLDAIEASADALARLATELAEEADLCRVAAVSLPAAAAGGPGEQAAAAAAGWGALLTLVAGRAAALSATLLGSVASYRALEGALAAGLLVVTTTPGRPR